MSFLKMSAVGHLPADQKLKRGEVLLQYTKVLAQPEYMPIPFHKQQVKTIKCDLAWTFTKLMKKIHKHDGCKPPGHVRELLWEVEQEAKRKKAELEEAKRIFKDRFTGVKGLSRFGHEQKKAQDDDEIDSEEHSDVSRGANSDYTTDHTDGEDEDAPPPPPSPPLMPAPASAAAAQQQQEEEDAEPGGSPQQVQEQAAEEEQQQEEQAVEEEPAEEQPVQEQQEEQAVAEEQPAEEQQQEEQPAQEQPAAEEEAAPAEEAAAAGEEQGQGFESPTDDPERLAPGHQVLAAVSGSTSRPPAHPGSRASLGGGEDAGASDAAEHGAMGRRRSWVETANDGQHAMAAAMMGRRASMERRNSGSQQQQQAVAEQTGEASVQHSRQASGVPAAASSSRPASAVHTELPISQPLHSSSSKSALHASASKSALRSAEAGARSRPMSAVVPAEEDGAGVQAGSRPISAVQPAAASSRPISAVQPAGSSSRPISAVQAASSSRPASGVKQSSRPDSAVAPSLVGSRPTSAVAEQPDHRVLGSRPTSAVLGSRPTSAAQQQGSGSKSVSVHGSRPTTAQRATPLSQQKTVTEDEEKKLPGREEEDAMFVSGEIKPDEHLLGADTGYDFDAIRAAQSANPDGGFLPSGQDEPVSDEPDARAILKGNVNVDDADDDEPGPSVEDDVIREGPRPYGFLPFLKISRNGFTKEVRIPGFGDKYIDPPIGWLREKFRFAAPAGVHAFVTLHAYGYTVYAKNNIRF